MQIQVALDFGTVQESIELVRQVQHCVDIIEIGTPMIFKYGVGALVEMKQQFPQHKFLFDGKIVDAGGEEAEIAFDAGADIVTVLATANDATLQSAVSVAQARGRQVFADLLGTSDIAARSKQLVEMGIDYIGIHIAHDIQGANRTFDYEFKALQGIVESERLAVAGGINPELAAQIACYSPGVVIVGTALLRASDRPGLIASIKENLGVA